MRDTTNGRSGFDRVLAAVAATFLTVSAPSAFAQTDSNRGSPAELAIDAAVPRPEPADVPPPTAADFKSDITPPATAPVASAPETPAAPATTATVSPATTVPSVPETPVATAPAASTPATAAKPAEAAPAVASAEQPVADKVRDLLAAKSTAGFNRKGERAAVEKFYAARNYAPVWTERGVLTAAAKGVISRLGHAAADGLDAADYPIPDFAKTSTPDALAEAELKLTSSALDYARQAQSGRMHWSQVASDIQYPEHPIDPAEVLAHLTTATDASAALESYNPPQKGFRDLRRKLAELRGQDDGLIARIPSGPALQFSKPKKKQAEQTVMEDPRVPQLRARLGLTENADDTRYDATVASAVSKFQSSADLKATGILDERTLAALNSPKRDRQIDTVLVNMERWRWLPRQLGASAIGNAYVMLNIPDFTLKVMRNDAQVWTTRVVVGKPGKHATPLLTETMKYITVNPTWNVPPSIIYNEYLPALQQDPTVLDRMGMKLERRRDGSIHISQPPGEANALGRIRFNFPNKFLVYQHDTPDKKLFAHDVRAYSHGCMRVQNPDQYAATLLNIVMPNEKYTPDRVRSMYGRSEIDLKFATPVPVHLTYQTAFVDDAGKLQTRKDIYGRDAQMLSILRNSKGKDLETVVAHAQPSYARPRADIPQGVAFNEPGGRLAADNGMNFFERLFGGGMAPQPEPNQRPRRVITR